MTIAFFIYVLVVGVPYLWLWRSYKKALSSFVSPQDEVVVAVSAEKRRQIVILALIGWGFLALAGLLFFLIRAK
jgi:uncharacterized membrane protein